jgi:hypothetical protein
MLLYLAAVRKANLISCPLTSIEPLLNCFNIAIRDTIYFYLAAFSRRTGFICLIWFSSGIQHNKSVCLKSAEMGPELLFHIVYRLLGTSADVG